MTVLPISSYPRRSRQLLRLFHWASLALALFLYCFVAIVALGVFWALILDAPR